MAQLETWEDVEAHLSASFRAETPGPRWVRLLWSFPTADGPPLVQAVEVTAIESEGRAWVRLLAAVVQRAQVDAERALRRNYHQVVGSLALVEDLVYLRHDLALPIRDSAELDRAVASLPRDAAVLRRDGALAPAAIAFPGYSD